MTLSKQAPVMIFSAALVFGLACRKPEPVKPPEPPKVDTSAQDAARAKAAAEAEAKRKAAAEEEARRKAEQERMETARRAEAAALAAFKQAAEKALQDIHFDYDMFAIKETDKAQLQAIANFLKANPKALIQIEGHCDERGTAEYNLALGEKRASAAKAYLKALGIEDTRMSTLSYGKEKPLCTEGNEACWHRNRRAHFALKG